ncbi:hypothetical protein, partial [Salmonella sp. s51090]|uniref:hypothetical protein n=1 Tax=Salmonella sp. s51090 TaxID=3159651 RepID=UPI00398042FC
TVRVMWSLIANLEDTPTFVASIDALYNSITFPVVFDAHAVRTLIFTKWFASEVISTLDFMLLNTINFVTAVITVDYGIAFVPGVYAFFFWS